MYVCMYVLLASYIPITYKQALDLQWVEQARTQILDSSDRKSYNISNIKLDSLGSILCDLSAEELRYQETLHANISMHLAIIHYLISSFWVKRDC